jgi:tRNA G18 (ribose-2'-O)-methylase SpoU
MGNEGRGVSEEILDKCDKYIYIEVKDSVESLNVSIAASILLYELSRE